MSSVVPPRRSMKKCARDASRRKRSLSIDLNTPPAVMESRQPTEILPIALGLSTTTETVVEASASRVIFSPIDVEALEDDDVQMWPPPRGFPQVFLVYLSWLIFAQYGSKLTNRPVTVVLDDELELSTGASVINVEEPPSQEPSISSRRRHRFSPSRMIINCESYVNVEDDRSSKFQRTSNPLLIEQQKVVAVAKEPVFSCPICLNSLSDACSTICGHVFCQSCIKQAIRSQKKCPTCRKKLSSNNFHRVFLPSSS